LCRKGVPEIMKLKRFLCGIIAFLMAFSLSACNPLGLISEIGLNLAELEETLLVETQVEVIEVSDEEAQLAAQKLAEIEDRVFEELVTEDSLSFNLYMDSPENFGLSRIEPSWGRYYTREYFDEVVVLRRELLEELSQINVHHLRLLKDQILYKTLVQLADVTVRSADFFYHSEPFNTSNGMYSDVPLVMAEFYFREQADIDTYLTLMRTFGDYIDRELNYEKEKVEMGLFMPDFSVDKVIETCEGNLENRGDEHFLVETFDRRIDNLDWLDDEQKQQYKEENKLVLEEYFFPVYEKIISEFELLRGKGGLTHLDAKQQQNYRLLVELNTSSNFETNDIIKLLDKALENALKEIQAVMREDPTVADDYMNLALSKGTLQENMDYLKSIYTRIFPKLPPHNVSLEVLPESLQFINAAAYIFSPPIDHYRDNIIRVNPSSAEDNPDLLYLLAHEGYAGHLLELVHFLYNDMGKLRYILNNIAFGEGFADYSAARLLFASDFDENLIRFMVNYTAFNYILAARMELGIFHEGWDLDDMNEYFNKFMDGALAGLFEEEELRDFYETCYETKNVYLRYGMGRAFFNDLRNRVERIMGRDFDEKEYHTLILEIGRAPLNVFEEVLLNAVTSE